LYDILIEFKHFCLSEVTEEVQTKKGKMTRRMLNGEEVKE